MIEPAARGPRHAAVPRATVSRLRKALTRPRLVALALVGLAALVLVWAAGRRPAPPPPAGPAGAGLAPAEAPPTAPVAWRDVVETAYAVGTVRARVQTSVSARAMGHVEALPVGAGERVERGQVLVVLSGDEARARLSRARAALAAATADLAEARREHERARQLVAWQVAPRRELTAAAARAEVAQARVREARAALREAEAGVGDLVVRAPVTGIVADTGIDLGELAVPGRTLLTLYDPGHLRLEAMVREELAGRLAAGQPVTVAVGALGAVLQGAVEVVVPAADPGSRVFLVKVALPPAPGLYPGMFGRLGFPAGRAEVLAVPREAIREVGQLETVDVVEDGVARTRQVRTGKTYGAAVEVLAGLAAGERVVLHGGPGGGRP